MRTPRASRITDKAVLTESKRVWVIRLIFVLIFAFLKDAFLGEFRVESDRTYFLLCVVSVGVVCALFFNTVTLWSITGTSVITSIFFTIDARGREIGGLLNLLVIACLIVINISMWITFYVAADQQWLGDFFSEYILRKQF